MKTIKIGRLQLIWRGFDEMSVGHWKWTSDPVIPDRTIYSFTVYNFGPLEIRIWRR